MSGQNNLVRVHTENHIQDNVKTRWTFLEEYLFVKLWTLQYKTQWSLFETLRRLFDIRWLPNLIGYRI